jgi:mono/diheme cytochrome c family protein
MMERIHTVVTWLFTVFTCVAIGHADQARERDSSWIAPSEHAQKPNPLTSRPDAAAGGAKIFRQRCSTCHGDDGRGTAKAPDLTAPDVQAQSDGALFWKITSGNAHAGMPTFSYLPAPQRWQLVLQLRALAADAAVR